MTDKTDIAALREAAIKATPGNWKLGIGSTYAYVQASVDMKLGGKSFVKLCHVGRAGWRNQQSTIDDARYIALANPVAILAILDQLDVINKSEWNLAGDLVDAHNLLGSERQKRAAAEKELDDLKAVNQHFDLAIRKSEVVNAKLRVKLEKAEANDAGIIRDANRYRFLRDEDAWGEDSDSWNFETRAGLISWGNLCEVRTGDFDAAIDARMAASDIPFLNPVTAPQKPVVLPGINEDLIDILGRPNFTCSGLAEIFRRNGADIKRKSENEQAFVIHWLLGIYLNHGSDWRTTAESEIKELAAKANAGVIVKDGE